MTEGVLHQWVIYHDTTDYPGMYVVRRWDIGPGSIVPDTIAQVCPDLGLARDVVSHHAPGAYRLPRQPEDDPCIVEVWV